MTDHLPKSKKKEWRNRLAKAYGKSTHQEAKEALWECVSDLRALNPSAARSLLEGMEETLTLHKMGVSPALRQTLSTTNIIESGFSCIRNRTNRVRRWHDGDHVQRWVASSLLIAEEKSWPKIKGWKQLWRLWEILERNKDMDRILDVNYNRKPTSSLQLNSGHPPC